MRIDHKRFEVTDACWLPGDSYAEPGYYILIKMSGKDSTRYALHVNADLPDPEWILKQEPKNEGETDEGN